MGFMKTTRAKLVEYSVLGIVFLNAVAEVAANTPAQLEAVRQTAMELIQSGQRIEAAELLFKSLSSLPPKDTELALPAIGAVQLLMFTNEYLMTEEERQTLYRGTLDEAGNEMHKFLATLMRYMDDAGISQEEATNCARDLYYLTQCENMPVRLGALFTMSSPYYFYDTGLGQQARDQIAAEFPGNFLSLEAQRLTLYYARTGGAVGLKEAIERKDDNNNLRPHSLRLQADPVGRHIYTALKGPEGALDDTSCVTGLVVAADSANDWAEEYAALNILEGFHGTASAPTVREAMNRSINRARDPRPVFRARVVRMSIARNEANAELLMEDARALLELDPMPVVPERNNFEELKNSIQQASDYLAENGDVSSARELLTALANRFPETVLAGKLTRRIDELGAQNTTNAGR